MSMPKPHRFLWLNGVFDEVTVQNFKSISPASNYWQSGFLKTLIRLGDQVYLIGCPAERLWPLGRLILRKKHATVLQGLDGRVIGYINFPKLREATQYWNLLGAARKYIDGHSQRPDYSVVFSCLHAEWDETPEIRVAKYLRKHFGVPWICIVADGATPPGADKYVFLPWANYMSARPSTIRIHLDGGIAEAKGEASLRFSINASSGSKALMYMGALTEHGGVLQLARAFTCLAERDVELWICGRGYNPELERIAIKDPRIKLKGFVDSIELDRLAQAAYAFINPRPSSFAPNQLNFPSKLLHYLEYGKPVLSTHTEGLSPSYSEVLCTIPDETESALRCAIIEVLALPADTYDKICESILRFNETHTWTYQVNRFQIWLDESQR